MKSKNMRTPLSLMVMSMIVVFNTQGQALKVGRPALQPIQPIPSQTLPTQAMPIGPEPGPTQPINPTPSLPIQPTTIQPTAVLPTAVLPTPIKPLPTLEPRRSSWSVFCSRLLWVIGCNDVTRHDAAISVRAGFSGQELSLLWPDKQNWRFTEQRVGAFSHLFIAQKIS